MARLLPAAPAVSGRSTRCVLLALLLVPALAAGQSLEARPNEQGLSVVRGGREVGQLALPERPRAVLLEGSSAWVALGRAGLWRIDLGDPGRPQVAERRFVGREVSGVLRGEGGRLYLVEASYTVTPFEHVAAPPPPPPAAGAVATGEAAAVGPPLGSGVAPQTQGSVVAVVQGRAILDRGAREGLALGERVEVFSQQRVVRPDLQTGELREQPSNESVAVLVVEQVEEGRASASLHRGDRVRAGDRFVVTGKPPSERLFMPGRQPFTHRVSALLRPVIELGVLGVGTLSSLRYGYHFEAPFSLEVGVTPLALELREGAGPRRAPLSFDALGSYDTDFFAVGFGVGALAFNPREEFVFDPGNPGEPTLRRSERALRLGLFQAVRLGALDGLSVEVRNSFAYARNVGDRDGDGQPEGGFEWGSTEVRANVPLTRRLTLSGAGGGGTNGWAYGELGIRSYFRGTGGAGTLIVPVSVGFGGVTGGGDDGVGPLFSIGLELRL